MSDYDDDDRLSFGGGDDGMDENDMGSHDGDDRDDELENDEEDEEELLLHRPELDNVILSGSAQAGKDARPREPRDRVTVPVLTKYERARILGTRAVQISMNAPVLVAIDGETDPLIIAEKELRERVIPLIVRRVLPDNTYEDWGINELDVDLDRPGDERYVNS